MIERMVDAIADRAYTRLASSIPPKLSRASHIDAEQTAENACLGFGEWPTGQLAVYM